jgi:hypothetical protein
MGEKILLVGKAGPELSLYTFESASRQPRRVSPRRRCPSASPFGWHLALRRTSPSLGASAFERLDFATSYTGHLEPLPCWAHLSSEEYRKRLRR